MNPRRLHTVVVVNRERGSVLIVALWVCFGLVALVLYFAQSTSAELRAAHNRAVGAAAESAVEGGARYVQYVLTQSATNGTRPLSTDYEAEALPIGESIVWLIGRDPDVVPTQEPVFNLVDEASKLNLNKATRAMLEALPGMTAELAGAIVDWRDTDLNPTENGAEDETYARLNPPRRAKNAPFESVDELRLVYGATLPLLFGEDNNRNGALDANEDDGETTAPMDDRNGILLEGILDFVTVYSSQPETTSDGMRRVDVKAIAARQRLLALLASKLSRDRAETIRDKLPPFQEMQSVAEFMVRAELTPEEFQKIHADVVSGTTAADRRGLINVNTATEAVLGCIPGIGVDKAKTITAYRLQNPDSLTSFAWLKEVLTDTEIFRAGPFITDLSYQFSADIAGIGPRGRGYSRIKYIFDTTQTTPRIVYRQDLSGLGWALGAHVRDSFRQTRFTSR